MGKIKCVRVLHALEVLKVIKIPENMKHFLQIIKMSTILII